MGEEVERRYRDSPTCSFPRERHRRPASLPGVSSTAPRAGNPRVKRAIIAVGVLVLVALLGYQYYRASQPPRGGDPHNDIPALKATKYYDFAGGDHRDGAIKYAQVPPAGGPHNPTWLECGAYAEPVPNQNAVHDLEHGTVWITYRPGLDQTDVTSLETRLKGLKSGKWMLSPYPGLPAPVVVTVWNAQLDLTGADDPRLPKFLAYYGDGHTGPEAAFASCKGGEVLPSNPPQP
jgi:hypothetical protein